MGKLTAIYGPMFAGKTTEIVSRCRNAVMIGKKILVIKYGDDNRYTTDNDIITHSGNSLYNSIMNETHINNKCIIIQALTANDIINNVNNYNVDLLVIDEAQFFSDIYNCVSSLMIQPKYSNLDIIVAGLDLDAQCNIFNNDFNMLITIADEAVYKLARCYICNNIAQYTLRINNTNKHTLVNTNIEIGGADMYQPVCSDHHT